MFKRTCSLLIAKEFRRVKAYCYAPLEVEVGRLNLLVRYNFDDADLPRIIENVDNTDRFISVHKS